MSKAASAALIVMFVVLGGGLMLAAGERPLRVALVIGGMTLLLVRVNAVIDRGRVRRGQRPDLSVQFRDVFALTSRDWLELVATIIVGAGLAVTGLVAYGSGA